MKKLVLTLLVAMMAFTGYAQSMKVQDAFNFHKNCNAYIKDAETRKAQGKMEKAANIMKDAKTLIKRAKDAIDAAAEHEGTSTSAKTWHYRGIIYYEIGHYEEFHDLDPNALDIALQSFLKAKELDNDYYEDNKGEFRNFTTGIGNEYYQFANAYYEQQDFANAMNFYMKAYDAAAVTGKVDNQSLLGAAQCAYYAKDFAKSAEYFGTIINNGATDPSLYYFLAESYKEMGNPEEMLSIIDKGLAQNVDNELLTNEKINALIVLGRETESIGILEEMAAKNPDKPVYYFNLGTIYGNANTAVFDIEKAIECYDKAIAVDAKYENAYINAGGLYIDQAADLYKQAEDVWENKEISFNDQLKMSDEFTEQAKSFDEKALPYVEKAYELLPDEPAIKQVLRGIYTRLKMNDKAAALN